MIVTERIKQAMAIVEHKPVTMDSLLEFDALLNAAEAEGEMEERRLLGLLWEPLYWVMSSELIVEWEAYRKKQREEGKA